MTVFGDTSAWYGMLDTSDSAHAPATHNIGMPSPRLAPVRGIRRPGEAGTLPVCRANRCWNGAD